MKALILAAGYGTRLLPHTRKLPKPLFPLGGKPILEICIERLLHAGCRKIFINTHHLHDQVENFINSRHFPVSVTTVHEPEILETGGAIMNLRDAMADSPFMVINSDVVTSLDLSKLWQFHLSGGWPVTLALHHHPRFNKIAVDENNFITNFFNDTAGEHPPENNVFLSPSPTNTGHRESSPLFAFTGIQVLSPEVFDYMPETKKFSSIELYETLSHKGNYVKAYMADPIYWQDIGTPETYRDTVICHSALSAGLLETQPLHGDLFPLRDIALHKLAGDGSDRRWLRCNTGNGTCIIADHGIHGKEKNHVTEMDSFISIGSHLQSKNIPVPRIKIHDRFSGIILLEDLGETHLQDLICNAPPSDIIKWYRRVCRLLIRFSIEGKEDFCPDWTFQTPSYSKALILEKECRYFVDAFLNQYLNTTTSFDHFINEFNFIADNALANAFYGLMHRDMQSRNIMIRDGQIFFIDFQSARTGPLQYDLASLLIDPYVNLEEDIREALLNYCALELQTRTGFETDKFIQGYRYCALTRNLQILGAFSHLSLNRGKTYFQQYIPVALQNLKNNLAQINTPETDKLHSYIRKIKHG